MRHAANLRAASRQRYAGPAWEPGELRDPRDTYGQRRRYGTESAWNTPDRDRDEREDSRDE